MIMMMMMMKTTRTLVWAAVVAALACFAMATESEGDRSLKATFDFFDIMRDICNNNPDGYDGIPTLGRCNVTRFPTCGNGTQICYNRKPSRDVWDPITKQPQFFIQYDRVFCYPDSFGGCSSCTPGRYCQSELRCIFEDINYPCAQWY